MNSPLFRRLLGICAILIVILLTYRQQANGSNSKQKSGKLLSVTAATRLSGTKSLSPVLVKGLLRKNKKSGQIYLVDEDSLSTRSWWWKVILISQVCRKALPNAALSP